MTRRLPLIQAPDQSRPVSRRQALAVLTGMPAALALGRAERIWDRVSARRAAGAPFVPRFFRPHEWRTVHRLAEYVIPRDARSGSATDAGVPEFMDFMMLDKPELQLPMRGGLHWLDTHCRERFGAAFVDCPAAQQTAMLDEIAWPARARPELSPGVAFFSGFRDLTASGFWTSPMGIADLQYMGNTVVHEWNGCPSAALAKLGVSYD